MRKLPDNLEKILDKMNKKIWWTGEVSKWNVYSYHVTTNIIGSFGYEVDKHKDNVEIYRLRRRINKK